MDFYDTIFNRRTVHNYLPEPVSDETVDRILAAAHMAPNHKLTWPWRFTLVGSETREQLLPIACKLKGATSSEMIAKISAKLLNPGALIVVTQHLQGDEFRQNEDYAAVCCAIQNILLAARAEGLGSKWSTGGLTQHPLICDLLEVDPVTEKVVGFIWVGTPKSVPVIERPELEMHIKRLA